jgi:IclR family pca regulon transcriptional regulator
MTANPALLIQALEKGLCVLEAFRYAETMNLQEIARASGITAGSAQRVAYTLEHAGYLQKDARNKRYRVTVKAVGLGYSFLLREPLFQHANSVLHQLNQQCGQVVNLSVPDAEGNMVFVMRVAPSRHIPIYMPVGTRIPCFASASGRAMYAQLTTDELEQKLTAATLQKHTPRTTTDKTELRRLIDEARENRYAYADEEFYSSDINVAAAIMNESGNAIAALTISVPKPEWNIDRAKEELGPLVLHAARAISRQANQP